MGQTFESLTIDRKLPERSNLVFYFQKPNNTNDYFKVTLPFFENVKITESKKARFQKYNLISRSSQLYSYQGADSRQLGLTFNMTLPHILSVIKDTSFQKYQSFTKSEDLEEQKELFRKPQELSNIQSKVTTLVGDNYTKTLLKPNDITSVTNDLAYRRGQSPGDVDVQRLMLRHGLLTSDYFNQQQETSKSLNVVANKAPKGQGLFGLGLVNQVLQQTTVLQEKRVDILSLADSSFKYKVIDLVLYWLNIIRSSCSNNAKNPIFGPPIIRLSHGLMYQDIPCICTDFNISYEENAGYDVDTLLPRIIRIEMKLEEVRTGDFGAGSDNYYVTKDNLKGWEAVISDPSQSMDPGYNYVLDVMNKPVRDSYFGPWTFAGENFGPWRSWSGEFDGEPDPSDLRYRKNPTIGPPNFTL